MVECGCVAGDLLNLILYVPYGGVSWQWKREGKKMVAIGFALSTFCDAMQYLTTGRGMVDVNDVLFNTLGALLFTPFPATRFAMHRIYANRINSRGMSRVFCDLRSQKTPRGILPVNSNLGAVIGVCIAKRIAEE